MNEDDQIMDDDRGGVQYTPTQPQYRSGNSMYVPSQQQYDFNTPRYNPSRTNYRGGNVQYTSSQPQYGNFRQRQQQRFPIQRQQQSKQQIANKSEQITMKSKDDKIIEDEEEEEEEGESDDEDLMKRDDGGGGGNILHPIQFQRKRIERRIMNKDLLYARRTCPSFIIRIVRRDGQDIKINRNEKNMVRLNVHVRRNKIVRCVGWF